MRTVGVEEELLLVDLDSGRPRSVAMQVLGASAARSGNAGGQGRVGGSLEHELQQEQVETDTTPHADLLALQVELRSWRDTAIRAARDAGARLVATGSSPLPVEPTMMRDRRL